MGDDLNPYPVYIKTDETWLGDLPEHWRLLRIKTLFHERTQKGFPNESLLAATQSKGVVRKAEYENRTVLPMKDLHLLKLVHQGDFVISLRSFQGGIEYARDQGIISPAYTILYPSSAEMHGFLAWLLKSSLFIDNLTLFVTGIRQGQNIDYERLSRARLPIPPAEDQRAIVRFLDYADRRIKRYIRAKKKLIGLLDEEKQVIIHRAVACGPDPNVRRRPSGSEQLGDVPEHWEVCRAKELFREVDSRSTVGTEVLLSLRMHRGLVRHTSVSSVPITAEALIGFKRVEPGQVVMNRMRAAIGMFGVVREPGLVSPDYAVFQPRDSVDPDYFLHVFKTPTARTAFRLESKGLGTGSSGFMRLYTDRFGTIKFAVPPKAEQKSIVRVVATQTVHIDRAVDRLNREIGLCREYRARLIADVVTGKLDVRETAARFPSGVEELEPEEETGPLQAVEDEEADDADLDVAAAAGGA